MKTTLKSKLPIDMEVKNACVHIENNEIVIDIEFKEPFKDGDFLYNDHTRVAVIYKETNIDGGIISYAGAGSSIVTIKTDTGWGYTKEFRLATPKEKDNFLEQLEKEFRKKWNPEKKCFEDIYTPKFGDIVKVISEYGCERNYMICIMPDKEIPKRDTSLFYDIYNINKRGCLSKCCGYITEQKIVLASEAEKQELFDKLAEVGKRWNPETKQLEDIRWRAKTGESYYVVNMFGTVQKLVEGGLCKDEIYYNMGNYFKTPEAARYLTKQVQELFKNSKAE